MGLVVRNRQGAVARGEFVISTHFPAYTNSRRAIWSNCLTKSSNHLIPTCLGNNETRSEVSFGASAKACPERSRRNLLVAKLLQLKQMLRFAQHDSGKDVSYPYLRDTTRSH